jgi:hypothetical protein
MDYLYYTYHVVNALGTYVVEFYAYKSAFANSVIYDNIPIVLAWA